MKRDEFLAALEKALRRLPREERQEALDYYRDYIDDAGPEQEEAVIAALGSPKEVAAQIIQEAADHAVRPESEKRKKKPLTTVWLAILGVCASPVALPLIAVAVALMAVVLICVAALLITVLAVALAGVVGGVLMVIWGLPVLVASGSNGLVVVGLGLAMLGMAGLAGLALIQGGKYLIGEVAVLFQRLFRRKRRGEDEKQ